MKELTNLKRALRISYNNKKMFLLSCFFDILFFLAYGFATAPIYAKLLSHIHIISSFSSQAVQEATRYSKGMLSVLMHESIKPYFLNLTFMLLILAATTYILYCLFQAFNWKIALQLTGKKIKYMDYLKRFLIINILWFLLFIIYYLLGFAIDIRSILITTIAQAEPSSILNIVLTFYFILFAYFAAISYVNMSVKKSWLIGTKKIKELLPSVLLTAAYLLLANIIISLLIPVNEALGGAAGLILILPAFTIGRIYISLMISKA